MSYATKDHMLARSPDGMVEFWLIGDQVYRCDNGAGHDLFGCPRNRTIECPFRDWIARRSQWSWAHDVPMHYVPFGACFR